MEHHGQSSVQRGSAGRGFQPVRQSMALFTNLSETSIDSLSFREFRLYTIPTSDYDISHDTLEAGQKSHEADQQSVDVVAPCLLHQLFDTTTTPMLQRLASAIAVNALQGATTPIVLPASASLGVGVQEREWQSRGVVVLEQEQELPRGTILTPRCSDRGKQRYVGTWTNEHMRAALASVEKGTKIGVASRYLDILTLQQITYK